MVTINVDNAHPGCDTAGNMGLVNDCEALLDSKDALGGTLNWDAGTAVAGWDGVTVSDDTMRVTQLWLRDKGLDGTISAALGRLEMLRVLNLHTNELTGEIPDLSALALTELYLSNNQLTGGIPAWLNGETDMTDLWLWMNQLSGAVPDLSGMTSIDEIKLQNNMLDGGVPDGSMLPGNASMILLQYNDLGGRLDAADLSGLSVRTLWLHGNGLTGSIDPAKLPASVTNLLLRENSLSGDIPDMSVLSNLVFLRLNENDLTGTVPGTLGDLENLEKLRLNDNQLTSIEAGLENAADTLTNLFLAGNNFAEGTCLMGGLADVVTNDFTAAGLAACQ
jgi:Leucine-rich repeat (LRR) protein